MALSGGVAGGSRSKHSSNNSSLFDSKSCSSSNCCSSRSGSWSSWFLSALLFGDHRDRHGTPYSAGRSVQNTPIVRRRVGEETNTGPREELCSSTQKVVLVTMLVLLACLALLPDRFIVSKLQVGLLVDGSNTLQRDLNRIGEISDTSSPSGWNNLLKKSIECLLKNDKSWISSYSLVEVKYSTESADNYFDELSFQERMKFDKDTLVNLNNNEKKTIYSEEAEGEAGDRFRKTYFVVTILVSAKVSVPPPVTNREGLKKALNWWSSHNPRVLQGVQILWFPQIQNEIMSSQRLHKDYPLLKPFKK